MLNKILFVFYIISLAPLLSRTQVTLLSMKCRSLQPKFSDFEYCYLHKVNRSYSYFSVKVKLYKVPVTNITTAFALLKRANIFKPFLYNFSVDACKVLKDSSRNPLMKFFLTLLSKESNMNHTCPYDHDLIVEKLSTSQAASMFNRVLPLPKDDYAIYSTWIAYNVPTALVNWYFNVK